MAKERGRGGGEGGAFSNLAEYTSTTLFNIAAPPPRTISGKTDLISRSASFGNAATISLTSSSFSTEGTDLRSA